MEACNSRMLFRPIQSFSVGRGSGCRDRIHRFSNPQCYGFMDHSHLTYYNQGLSISCDGKKKDAVIVMSKEAMKKKLKLLKSLCTDLSMYTKMASDRDTTGALLSDLSQVLMSQLEHMKEEKKETKRRKALKMKVPKKDEDSSTSSSDSSDSECEPVFGRNRLRRSATGKSTLVYAPQDTEMKETLLTTSREVDAMLDCSNILAEEYEKVELTEREIIPMSSKQGCCTSVISQTSNSTVAESFPGRIDVCMGGKCKKFGAEELLNQLQNKIGVEGAVVGCKCMGKCKNAPNVRVSANSITAPNKPTHITGVGLEDVDMVASKFLGEDRRNVGWMEAT